MKSVEFVSKAQALEELKDDLGKEKAQELTSQLSENPLPASYRITPDDAANLDGIRERDHLHGARTASAARSPRSSKKSSTARTKARRSSR